MTELATQAENNRIAVLPIVPNRGLILDRNGVVLANNYSAYTLEITPIKGGRPGAPPSTSVARLVEVQRAGPQALQATARGEQEFRVGAAAHQAHR